jgi:hypothetical protein
VHAGVPIQTRETLGSDERGKPEIATVTLALERGNRVIATGRTDPEADRLT